MGGGTKIAMWAAALALAVALFPTARAVVNGSSSHPSIATTTSPPNVHLALAERAASEAAPSTERIMLVGNSVAFYLAPGFKALSADRSITVLDESIPGCYFPPEITGVRLKLPDGTSVPQTPCDPAWEASAIERFRPSLVFWMVSSPSYASGAYHGQPAQACSPTYSALFDQRLAEEVRLLGAGGARVVIPTAGYSSYFGAKNRDRITDCENASRFIVAAETGAQLVDLFSYVCPRRVCRKAINGVPLRPDGLHFEGPGGVLIARWLLDQVREPQ